jgi:replication factor C small subunit
MNQVGDDALSQNFLLVGSPGTGKSSLARILIGGRTSKTFNLSSERGINTVRTDIQEFCSTKSMYADKEDYKVVFLDEMDGATDALYLALRATMEKFQKNVRFIGTCNYLSKIPEPIQSRFLVLDYTPQNSTEEEELISKYKIRLKKILDQLQIKYENDTILDTFIAEYFPDYRAIIKQVQSINQAGITELTTSNYKIIDERLSNLFSLTTSKPDPVGNYKNLISLTTGKHQEIFGLFSRSYVSWLIEKEKKALDKIPQIIQVIADWNFKSTWLVDPQLAVLAMVYQLQLLINAK